MSSPTDHRRALVYMLIAPVCWSTGGLFVRLLSIADAVGDRVLAIAVHGDVRRRRARRDARRNACRARCRASDWPGLLAGAFLAGQFFLFIASLTRTTVANTFVLMSISPFLAALAARVFLGERVPVRTWVGHGRRVRRHRDDVRRLARRRTARRQPAGDGRLGAVRAQLTVLRKVHATVDMLPMVMIAGLISIAIALPLSQCRFAGDGRRPRSCSRSWAACSSARDACCSSPPRGTSPPPSSACSRCSSRSSGRCGSGRCWASTPGARAGRRRDRARPRSIANEAYGAWQGRRRPGSEPAFRRRRPGPERAWRCPTSRSRSIRSRAIAILITGISKGGFAAGAAGLAVPLMSMFIAPPMAAGIMLPILCAMDIFGVHAYRGTWSRSHVARCCPARSLGIVLGGLAFGALSVERGAARRRHHLDRVRAQPGVRHHRAHRSAARGAARPPGTGRRRRSGAPLSGFTSTLAHAGGPPFAICMLPQRLDKTTLVATSALFFLVVNYVKLVPYAMLGQLNIGNLATSLLFAPLAPARHLARRLAASPHLRGACSTRSATRCCSPPASSWSGTRWRMTLTRSLEHERGAARCATPRALALWSAPISETAVPAEADVPRFRAADRASCRRRSTSCASSTTTPRSTSPTRSRG